MKQTFCIALIALLLAACSREEFPTHTPAVAEFELNGTLNGQDWNHQVGIDGSLLITDAYIQGYNSVFESIITDPDCENCEPVFWLGLAGADDQAAENVLNPTTSFDLNAAPTSNSWFGDFEEVMDAGFDVSFNDTDITDPFEEVFIDPGAGVFFYEVLGVAEDGQPIEWSFETFAFIDCWIEEISLPGITLELEDEELHIHLETDYTEGPVEVISDHPFYYGSFSADEEIVFPIIDLLPDPSYLSFLFIDGPTGLPLTFTLNFWDAVLSPLEIPGAHLVHDASLDTASAVLGMYYQGEEYMTSWYCEDWPPAQPEWSHFEITQVENYLTNEQGQDTRKITFDAHVLLYPAFGIGDGIELELVDATIAVAIPD